jgi:hypothetical protein
MRFVHKWLRKRPYAFYESCRGIGDLQTLLLITQPTSVEKFEEKLVQTVPSQILRDTSATLSCPRATSCAWPRQAALPADRARLPEHRCDRRSQGFRTDVRTQSILATRRTLTSRAKPTCAASQRRRRLRAPRRPWRLLAVAPRHRLAHATAHRVVTLVTPLAKARLPIKAGPSPLARPGAAAVRHRSHRGELYLRPPFTANTCCS